MNEYVSYEDVKTYLRITLTTDDTLLKGFCAQASRSFDAATRRCFYPHISTRYYDHPYSPDRLELMDDLLEVSAFTTQNTAITLTASDYYLMCGYQHNLMPYDRIVMRIDGNYPTLSYNETWQKANCVVGIWGYHEDWANAWDAVDVVGVGGINASSTSLLVIDADGTDLEGNTPRFKIHNLLKVEDEYMYVTARDAATNILTVRRAMNGTTAAVHLAAATVSVYRPMDDISNAVKRLAAWLYAQKDTPYTERIQAAQSGAIILPDAMPLDVRLTIARYSR